jgi:hypothetical protein
MNSHYKIHINKKHKLDKCKMKFINKKINFIMVSLNISNHFISKKNRKKNLKMLLILILIKF